ncbi:hypothetical protein J1N35_001182 [Gossypium stocksii]|uniref:Uncharacterized protein n=1 Tax=Gossypium stocksii TaxID=47602 RepID=A0A9D3WIF3_9ROSI|nr:hypothetical protein J1N35_001182 [Gossypium stocksii]
MFDLKYDLISTLVERLFAQLELSSTSYILLRALSNDKAPCHGHRWVPSIAAALGTLQDAILGISYSPNICLPTRE